MPIEIFHLFSNPYFSAGFGLLGVGTGLAILRNSLKYASFYFKRKFLISLEIPSKDKSFNWVMEWMSSQTVKDTQHVSVETNFIQYENGEVATKTQLIPSPGTHYFQFKGYWIQVSRQREKNIVDFSSGSPWETLTFTTLGRNRKIFEELLSDAQRQALQREEGSTVIYTTSGGDWRRFGFPRKKKPLHSVILDSDKTNYILSDVIEFLQSSRWYFDRGIPYRRGYLLYGPPGCGKSSFIMALAGHLSLNICILNLHSKGINDDSLNYLLNIAPQRSIILLEDIDAAIDGKSYSQVTFSGLLNALDGVAATEGGGRILFLTTNYIEKLQPVLIRPGRVDIKEYFGYASKDQLKNMFMKFFPDCPLSMAIKFSEKIKSNSLTMAQLQAYFMIYKNDPQAALDNIDSLNEHNNNYNQNNNNINKDLLLD